MNPLVLPGSSIGEEIALLLERRGLVAAADLQVSRQDRPLDFQSLTLELTTAATEGNPFILEAPFRTMIVAEASDTSAYINVAPHSRGRSANQNAFKLDIGAKIKSGIVVSQAFLTWPAQSGKTVKIYLSLDSEFDLGKTYSVNAGGVSISEGSSFNPDKLGAGAAASVSVGTTATQILPADSTRLVATLQADADLWIGNSGVTAGTGIFVPGGSTMKLKNTAAIYGITAAGTATVTGVVEI